MYKQLADHIRDQIVAGTLPAGANLPSESELAEQHGIAKNVVKQALANLRAEGLIVSGRGRLSRVRPIRLIGEERYSIGKRNYGDDHESAFAREHGVPWSEFQITRRYRVVPAPERVAVALGMPIGAQVFERQFTHATGGVMLRMSRSYLSAERFEGTILTDPEEPFWKGGTVGQLYSLGINVTRVRTEVTSREATPVEVDVLHLDERAWVLEAWRTQYADGLPVETACHVYPPGAQLLVFDIPVGPPPAGNEWYGRSPD